MDRVKNGILRKCLRRKNLETCVNIRDLQIKNTKEKQTESKPFFDNIPSFENLDDEELPPKLALVKKNIKVDKEKFKR